MKRLPAELFTFPRAFPWLEPFKCSLEFFDGRVTYFRAFALVMFLTTKHTGGERQAHLPLTRQTGDAWI